MKRALALAMAAAFALSGCAIAREVHSAAQRRGAPVNCLREGGASLQVGIAGCTAIIDSMFTGRRGLVAALHERSNWYFQAHDYARARADIERLLSLDPSEPEMRSALSLAEYLTGDKKKALADANAAVAQEPNSSYALHNRGLLFYKEGDMGNAIADLALSIRIEPTYASSYLLLGYAKRRTGNLAGGAADIAKAERLAPGIEKTTP